jgi:spore maturation protein SpmA
MTLLPGKRALGGALLNWIWLGLILVSVLYAAWSGGNASEPLLGMPPGVEGLAAPPDEVSPMGKVSSAMFDGAKAAVNLVIGLIGSMMLFLGLMNVAREGGLLAWVTRGLRPIMCRLFPDVPEDHPAMGAMVMNFASNVLGLGNAATPFGLKAMSELSRLNPHPGVATDSMVLFLAINTSAITLMAPTGTMALRAAAGSAVPAAIWIPTLIATTCSTVAAISTVYFLRRRAGYAPRPIDDAPPPEAVADVDQHLPTQAQPPGRWRKLFITSIVAGLLVLMVREIGGKLETMSGMDVLRDVAASWPMPILVVTMLLIGVAGRVRVYEATVAGAREGLEVGIRIVPFLVVILAAVAMFRASGALDLMVDKLAPYTALVGFPAEALPMAILRPLTGQGAYGVMAELLETHGPDSFVGMLVSTLQGSTETTFYVLTVYCGAAGVREVRHALPACLVGDVAGAIGATAACHLFFG